MTLQIISPIPNQPPLHPSLIATSDQLFGMREKIPDEKLNADLDSYPPPLSPDPKRRTGMWGRSSVWEILHNPKYTGFMVWNRRQRKRGGKINPESWVWSEEPAHEALVSPEMFDKANLTAT